MPSRPRILTDFKKQAPKRILHRGHWYDRIDFCTGHYPAAVSRAKIEANPKYWPNKRAIVRGFRIYVPYVDPYHREWKGTPWETIGTKTVGYTKKVSMIYMVYVREIPLKRK